MLHRFGTFELDVAAGELRRSGTLVRLQPQPFRVLAALVSRPGEVVTREELRELLWGEGTHVEFERGLNFAVNRLREALHDSARAPRFVETVQRRGYRFVAPVEIAGAAGEIARPAVIEALPMAPPSRPAGAGRPLAALLVVVTLLAASAAGGRASGRRAGEPRRSQEARELYDEARALCGPDGWRRSIRLYGQARDASPGLAGLSSTGIARSYVNLVEHGLLPPDHAFPLAGAAAREALRHGPSAEARALLATVLLEFEWRPQEARRELTEAERLARRTPGEQVAATWSRIARLRSYLGDDVAALDAARRAEASDPASDDAVAELAGCLYRAGRLEEAARAWRVIAGRRPAAGHHALFSIQRMRGLEADALAEAREVMRAAGVPTEAMAAVLSAEPGSAARLYLRGSLTALERRADRERVAPERLALLHAALGERGPALSQLEAAAATRSPLLLGALRDPVLAPLRREPRFAAIASAVGLAGFRGPAGLL